MTVLGFLVQCAICPQQAVVDSQPSEGGWLCPRCGEVADRPVGTIMSGLIRSESIVHDITATTDLVWLVGWYGVICACGAGFLGSNQAEAEQLHAVHVAAGPAAGVGPRWTYNGPGRITVTAEPDDEYPIGKVRG